MNDNHYPIYKHSGKFGVHGPLLAIVAAIIIGYPLGFVYVYLMKWIPFIYLHVFITAGYGCCFGFLVALLVKYGKVRNGTVAFFTGVVAGAIGWYLNWNAYIYSHFDQAPLFASAADLGNAMKYYYEHGAWRVGRFFGDKSAITGIPLATVWGVEALIIILLSAGLGWGGVSETPYCETHGCWLDEKKTFDKLDAFSNPDYIAALKSGNLAPLEQAQPRIPASGQFARLTLRHSSKCDDYCAFSVANVTVRLDKNGKQRESVHPIVTNLWVTKSMFNYLAQFDHATVKPLTPA